MRRLLLALLLTAIAGSVSAQTLALLPGEKTRQPVVIGEQHAWQIPKRVAADTCTPDCPEDVFPGVEHFWSLRAFNTSWFGQTILTVRRASDSTTANIVALAASGGSLDVATAATFCAATTCFATFVADQKGAVHCDTATTVCNWASPTTGQEPQLIFNCNGAMPCLRGTMAAISCLRSTEDATIHAQPLTYSNVVKMTWNGTTNLAVMGSGTITSNPSLRVGTSSGTVRVNAGTNLTQSHTDATWASWQAVFNGVSSVSRMNSAEVTGNAGANAAGSGGRWFMNGNAACSGATSSADMDWMETSQLNVGADATQRAAIETNQRAWAGF